MLVDFDELFVNYAVKNGYVTATQVEECRRRQNAQVKSGRRYYLGQVLIKSRLLSCEQFLEIENALEQKIYECAACKARYPRKALAQGPIECKGCGQRIEVEGRGRLSMAEILASRDPRDLTISLMQTQKDDKRRSSTRRKQARSSTRSARRSRRSRLNRDALKVAQDDLDGLERYEILEEIGRGGMGIVFKARQIDIDRTCALKVIKTGPQVPEVQINRFVQEGKSAARLGHPNIITIYDCGRYRDIFFVAMEFIDGLSLAQILSEEKKLPIDRALKMLLDVLSAVEYAHENGVVHRDLKPGNILLERERERARLIDFGLAKDTEQSLGLTQDGQILGSPFYLSPEQTRGHSKDVDGRADLFALGVILYEVLTGQRPFTGRSAAEVYGKILNARPTPPSVHEPEIDQQLQSIVLKALEKGKRDRFQDAAAFAARITAYQESRAAKLARKSSKRIKTVSARAQSVSRGTSARGPSARGTSARATGAHKLARSRTSTRVRSSADRERARPEPHSGKGAPTIWIGIGAVIAIALGLAVVPLIGGKPVEDRQGSVGPGDVPIAEPSDGGSEAGDSGTGSDPGVSAGGSLGEPPPPEDDRRSPEERAFARAADYEQANSDDPLGALELYRDAQSRGGPWARKAEREVARLQIKLQAEIAQVTSEARAKLAAGDFPEAAELLAAAESRYEGVAGVEAVGVAQAEVVQRANAHADSALEAARSHIRGRRLPDAIAVLEAYTPTGIEAADAKVTKAMADMDRLAREATADRVRASLEARDELVAGLAAVSEVLRERRYADAESQLAALAKNPWTGEDPALGATLALRRRELELARSVVEAVAQAGDTLKGAKVTVAGSEGRVSSLRGSTVIVKLKKGGRLEKALTELPAVVIAQLFTGLPAGRRGEAHMARAVFLLLEGQEQRAFESFKAARKRGVDLGEFESAFAALEAAHAKREATRPTKTPDDPKRQSAGGRVKDDAAMLQIPAGAFLMGISVRSIESDRFDEIPGREVTLGAYRIDRYEVTNRQYARFLTWQKKHKSKAHKYCSPLEPLRKTQGGGHIPEQWEDPRFQGDGFPVVGVDWFDAYGFAKWAGKRLPTEAEWERAARFTDGRTFPWGDELEPGRALTGNRIATLWGKPLSSQADINAFKVWLNSVSRLVESVDAFEAGRSAEGAFNLCGNVSEWTADRYQRTYYQVAPAKAPKGPATGAKRVARGGSWLDFDPKTLTCTAREPLVATTRRMWLGFRCAQDPGAQPSRRLR